MIRLASGQYLSHVRARRETPAACLIETTYASGERLPRHRHEFAYLVLMISGVLREHAMGQAHDLTDGCIVFNEAGESHENEVLAPGTRCLNVELAPCFIAELHEEGLRPLESLAYTHAGPAVGAIGRLYTAAIDPGPDLEVEEALVRLLGWAWGDRASAESAAWLPRVRALLHARFRESLSLGTVAAEAGVGRVHLCRAFKRAIGCTIGEYIRALRTAWALGEVTGTAAPLAGLAARAGFADQSHMTRAFARTLGRTPGRLRAAAAHIPFKTVDA